MLVPMTPRRLALTALAVIAVAFGSWLLFFRSSDEALIRAKLAKLAKETRVTAEDTSTNPIGRFAHVNDAFKTLFDRDVRVSIPEVPGIQSGRKDLAEAVTNAPRVVRTFEVDFSEIEIKLDDAKAGALVGATATIHAIEQGGVTRDDKRAVDFRFAKTDGDWLITSLTVWPKDEARPR
jgi:hypothetical protein